MLGATDNTNGISSVSYNTIQGRLYVGLNSWASNLQQAHSEGVKVFNMSLGIPTSSCYPSCGCPIGYNTYSTNYYSASSQSIINAATAAGMVVVSSAGNCPHSHVGYPALYDNVIAVVATDQNGNKASFSNYGQ
jgi:hypothetical protein